jgi:hypothetical protein
MGISDSGVDANDSGNVATDGGCVLNEVSKGPSGAIGLDVL